MKIIGLLLFVLFLLLTPAEVFSLSYFHKSANASSVMVNLLIAELLTFGVLWYMKEIERVNIRKELFHNYRKSKRFSILNRPLLLILGVGLSAFLWQISYANLIEEKVGVHLILFYVFVLPYITIFLFN